MIVYAFILVFSLVSSVRGSIYVQAPNHVPQIYLETLIRKFAKPLQDIQELTGEGVQLEFSIRSPDKNPKDMDPSDLEAERTAMRRTPFRGKILKKRGPSRLRAIPNKRLPPNRKHVQPPFHLQTLKPRSRSPIKQPNKPSNKSPIRLNKLPNKPSFKPVNKQRSRLYQNPYRSQHGQDVPERPVPQPREHQERNPIPSHSIPQPSIQSHPPPLLPHLSAPSALLNAMPPSLSHTTIMSNIYQPHQPMKNDRKEVGLDDINRAFVDLEKRIATETINASTGNQKAPEQVLNLSLLFQETNDKNILNNEVLNKTLEIFEKRILKRIGAPDPTEQQEQKIKDPPVENPCDDANILQEAFKPVLFEDLWKYLGKRKCEEEHFASLRTSSPKINPKSRKSMPDILNEDDHEEDANDNIFIHTGDYSPPIKIPLANVFSRLIF